MFKNADDGAKQAIVALQSGRKEPRQILRRQTIKPEFGKIRPRNTACERDLRTAGILQQGDHLRDLAYASPGMGKITELTGIGDPVQAEQKNRPAVFADRTRNGGSKLTSARNDAENLRRTHQASSESAAAVSERGGMQIGRLRFA